MRRRYRRRPITPQHELHPNDYPFGGQIVTAMVDNPYEEGPTQIAAARNLRNDPLAALLSRRVIDHAQFSAGRRWQQHYETAGIGMVIAMDPLKEPVDGGGESRAAFTDAQLYAFAKLKEARTALGLEGYGLVRQVLGDGVNIYELAKMSPLSTFAEAKYLGRRLRECLETIAQIWGFANGVRRNQTNKRGKVIHIDLSGKAVHSS